MNSNSNYNFNYSDECTSRGVCTTSPVQASLHELIFLFLKHCAYYILRLKKMGIDNIPLKLEIIKDISALISINEFSEKQLYELCVKYSSVLESLKDEHKKQSLKHNYRSVDIKLPAYINGTFSPSQAISYGEKIFLNNYNKLDLVDRNIEEILIIVIKNASYQVLKVYENAGINDYAEFDDIIYSLNMLNRRSPSILKIKKQIYKLANFATDLQIIISEYVNNSYGGMEKTRVPLSSKKGKAILVSGDNLNDLLKLLELTKGDNIDIYTHSELIIAHSLKLFKKYNNLAGHYGTSIKAAIIDFATFPGAILLAGSSKNSSDYLYRGKLFSNDYIIHSGITKIDNNNYEPVISASLKAKGFKKDHRKNNITVGCSLTEIIKKFNYIKLKLANDEITRIYFVGINPYSATQSEYFEEFFEKIEEGEYVISFSYESNKKNVFTINIGNYLPFKAQIIKLFLYNM